MFSFDKINSPEYEELSNIFFSMAKDDEIKQTMKDILHNGEHNGYMLNSCMEANDKPKCEKSRRLHAAYLLATHPETYEYFEKNNIGLFHGTNISALPGILKYGLNSAAKSKENGEEISAGENILLNAMFDRDFVSLTDDLGTALNYASLGRKRRGTIGAIIGVSLEDISELYHFKPAYSEMPEVGVDDSIPLEMIKAIIVPEDQIEFTKKLVGDRPIEVLPMEFEEIFFGINYFGGVQISQKRIDKMKEKGKYFGKEDLKEVSDGRRLSNMQKALSEINRGGDYGRGSIEK